MGACQREIGGVVVKGCACIAGGVTGIASSIFIYVPIHTGMPIVCFRVYVAICAGKFCKIGRILVTVRTACPLPLVFATIDREIGRIMLRIFGWCPARISGVTSSAIRGEIGLYVVWVGGASKIWLVAGKTVGRCIAVITPHVAFSAIRDLVALGQGEKIVLHLVRRPTWIEQVVTLRTIGGKARFFVIRIGGSVEIFQVTINTIVPDPFELQRGGGQVTLGTIQRFVYARERESVALVDIRDIVHHPVGGTVAACAIFAYRLLVHIGVAGDTV